MRVDAGVHTVPAAARALGDRLDHVVVLQLGPVVAGRHQVQHLAVAYALREEALRGGQRDPVGTPQQPAAVLLAVVGQPLAGVPQHLGQQLGERHVLGQRDVDPALRGADRDAGQADAHEPEPIDGDEAAERRALYLP